MIRMRSVVQTRGGWLTEDIGDGIDIIVQRLELGMES